MTTRAALANLEAEHGVLGAVIYDAETLALCEGLEPEHFREPTHGRIWNATREIIGKRGIADPVSVSQALAADAGLQELGGVVFVSALVDKCPAPRVAAEHAGIIRELATRRALIDACQNIATTAAEPGAVAMDQLHAAEKTLAEIARGAGEAAAWVAAGNVVRAALERARASRGLPGLTTGLRDLDAATGGLRAGQLTIVAGRPAMGKSTAALQLAKASAQAGRGVMLFSMEMPPFDLGLRMACDLAHDLYAPMFSGRTDNPRYFDASRGDLSGDHWRRLDQARAEVEAWPLVIDPRPGLTVPQMLAAARRRLREWERAGIEPGCIILDHLTIARPDQDRKGNKVAEVGDISRGLAEMAKTLDLPVVGLCQLSRDVEKRQGGDRRPGLSDLRWSGEIEQDARVVMFLYRPEYYLRKPEDPDDFEGETAWRAKLSKVRHKLFWLIEKNNNGPTAEVETYCDISCSAIRDSAGRTGFE